MNFLSPEELSMLGHGMVTTIQLFAVSWVMAFTVATILVIARAANVAPLRWLVNAYVEYHRNVPLLVHVLFWYFSMPEVLPESVRIWLYSHNAEFSLAVIALALGLAAYMSEDIRSGLRAIPDTQIEASRALGASYLQSMRYIVVPQALRLSIPPLVNRALLLYKYTSVAMMIGVFELSYAAQEIESATYRTFEVFGVATVMYLLGSFLIVFLGTRMHARFRIKGGAFHA